MQERASIILSAGRSCFVKCLGCYNFFGKSEDLTKTSIILDFLARAKRSGIEKVTIGGGDPLSRPDIIDLLTQVKGMGFKINVDTVGTPLLGPAETIFFGHRQVNQVSANSISSLVDNIGIPLDGTSSQNIQTFRTGRADIFGEQVRIIEILDKCKANICVNTVVHQQNHEQIPNILHTLANFSFVAKWQCFQFMPIGPLGYKNRGLFAISDDAFARTCDKIVHKTKEIKPSCKVEFKSRIARKGNYLLIDTDGLSWMPNTSVSSVWDSRVDANDERIVVGNINNANDIPKIIDAVLNPGREQKRQGPTRSDFLPSRQMRTALAV